MKRSPQSRKNARLKKQRNKRLVRSRKNSIDYAVLEPRVVMDAASLMADRAFDLPTEVSLKLSEAMNAYDAADANNAIPGSSHLRLLGTPLTTPIQDPWGMFDFSSQAAAGTTSDSSISTLPSDGGGHLVFNSQATFARAFDGTVTTVNSNGFAPGKSMTTTETATFNTALYGTEGAANTVVASGTLDPTGLPSSLSYSITKHFTFLENSPVSGEYRNFSVLTDYSISVALGWGGTGNFDYGETTQTVNYNTSIVLMAIGQSRYDGVVTQNGSGENHETWVLHASGIFSASIDSGNSVTTTTVVSSANSNSTEEEGRSDDFHFQNSGAYTILADGGIMYATGATELDVTRLDSETHSLTANNDTWSTYNEVNNLSGSLTDDPEDETVGSIFKVGGNGSTLASLIETMNASSSSQNRYAETGNSSYLYGAAVYPAGNMVESLGGTEYVTINATGNEGDFSSNYNQVATNVTGRSSSSLGTSGSYSSDESSVIATTTMIMAQYETPSSEPAIDGTITALGTSLLVASSSAAELTYDFRDGWASATQADTNGAYAAVAANQAALDHLNNYTPGGLGSSAIQAAVTASVAGSEVGKKMNMSWLAGKSTSSYSDHNDGAVTSNSYLTLNSMVGNSLALIGSSDMMFTSADNYSDSADYLRSFDNYGAQDGAVVSSQSDNRGFRNVHGMYGDDYDYSISENENSSTIDPEAATGFWFDKFKIVGNSSSYYDDTIDSGNDVSKTNDSVIADFTTSPGNYYRYSNHSNFDETETIDSGSSSSADDMQYKTFGQGLTTTSSGDLSTTTDGSGGSGYTVSSSFEGLLDPTNPYSPTGYARYSNSDTKVLTSDGTSESDWDGSQKYGIKKLNTPDPANEPAMIEALTGQSIYASSDDKAAYTQSGSLNSSGGFQYTFNSQLANFEDSADISFANTELSYSLLSKLKNESTPISSVTVTDDTSFSTKVESDGISMTSNGLLTTTIVNKSKLFNPNAITQYSAFKLPDTSTHSVLTVHNPNTIKLETDTTTTLRENYEDAGVKLTFDNEDLGDGTWNYLIPKLKNVGKVTASQKTNGFEYVEMHPTTTDSLSFASNAQSFVHSHHEDATTTTHYNDLANEQVVEFFSDGGRKETYSRTGNMAINSTRNTNGTYTWNDLSQKLGFNSPYKHDSGSSTYNSTNGHVNYSVAPSGSVELNYDADGDVSSYSGTFTTVRHADGNVDTHLVGTGKAFYKDGGNVYVGTRSTGIDRSADFEFDQTETMAPSFDAEGNLSYTGSKSTSSSESHSLAGGDIRSVYMAMASTIADEEAHINSVGFTNPGVSTTTTSSSSNSSSSNGTYTGGPGAPPPPGGGGGSNTPSYSVIRNYLLTPTDYAPVENTTGTIDTLADLTVFKELYGYEGGATTANFSTALPANNQADFNFDGELVTMSALVQDESDPTTNQDDNTPLELSDIAKLGLLEFALDHPAIIESYVKQFGREGLIRLGHALEWGYTFDFDADFTYDNWGVTSVNAQIGIDSFWESPESDASVLNTALIEGMKERGVLWIGKALIRPFNEQSDPNSLDIQPTRLRDLWTNWEGKSFNEAWRNFELSFEALQYHIATGLAEEGASELTGHGLAKAISAVSIVTILAMAKYAKRAPNRGLGWQNPMFKHALQSYNGGAASNAARALTKHPNIVGLNVAPDRVMKGLIDKFGSQTGINDAAAEALKNIMRNGTRTTKTTKAYGDVVDFTLPNGLGARFNALTNEFIGFLGRGL